MSNMEKTINMSEIYEKLIEIERNMATKQELDQAIETLSILSNQETMAQIVSSEKDIKKGNFREINSIDEI